LLADSVDIIEVFNSRSLFPGAEKKARSLAQRHGKLISYGSDGHSPSEIGYAFAEMPDFNGPQEFLVSLSGATFHGRKSSPLVHLITTTARLGKRSKRE
jgi:hypothetical protein